jgi:hypothetical protein
MKRFFQILLISFATLLLVANNVVLQYQEKYSIEAFEDQDDEEESKSEKTGSEEKIKEFINLSNSPVFTYKEIANKLVFILINEDQLPSISLDVELLPPNCL